MCQCQEKKKNKSYGFYALGILVLTAAAYFFTRKKNKDD